MYGTITQQQVNFLRLLAKTGFLTNLHLKQLNFGSPNASRHFLTKNLLDSKMIGRVMISANFGIGRKVMYYLAKKGAEFLAETDCIDITEIAYAPYKGGIYTAKDGGAVSLVRSDFIHKERYISFFLIFQKFLQETDYLLQDCRHYYQLAGGKGTSLTLQNRNFRPDGIWLCSGVQPESPQYIYVVEVHRHSNRKHIIKQLLQQVEAIKAKSVQHRFQTQEQHFVLSVFADENAEVMRQVIEELQNFPEWQYIRAFFGFASLNDLMNKDFIQSWAYFYSDKKPFPKILKKRFDNLKFSI